MNDKYRLMAVLGSALLFWHATALAGDSKAAQPGAAPTPAIVNQLLDKEQMSAPGKQLLMLTVEYPPGGSSPSHRHDAQVFVYVLEGEVIMQVAGSPALRLHAGETFYENPNDVHVVSANASTTSPAKILVFILKDKNAPVSRPAPAKG
jgi:quercetin dioxygenase-like cupin family protein